MKPFREQIAADNTVAFINSLEFADKHNLNGTECSAILQDISVAEGLSTGLNPVKLILVFMAVGYR